MQTNPTVKDNNSPPTIMTNLEVRLATSSEEIKAAQHIRYRIFFEEMGAIPTPLTKKLQLDIDEFDSFCDHLIVLDHSKDTIQEAVIGTYRLLRSPVAEKNGGFYSSSEFDIEKLVNYSGKTLEVGRSCVLAPYRNRATLQFLWKGIAQYIFDHDIDILFGCASISGIDIETHKFVLSYLHHYHLAPPAFRAKALEERYVSMNRVPESDIDRLKILREIPPLIKGYLRLGSFVGDGAVIDPDFQTTDVCIILQTELVTNKYLKHYERTTQAKEQSE